MGYSLKNGTLVNKYFNNFLQEVNTKQYIEVGRQLGSTQTGNWVYMNGIAYNIRIYDRPLSNEEVQANFETSKDFHEYLLTSHEE